MPARPPKRPWPEALTPPNGICASSCTVGPLTWQIPDSMRRAIARPRARSRVNTAAERLLAKQRPLRGDVIDHDAMHDRAVGAATDQQLGAALLGLGDQAFDAFHGAGADHRANDELAFVGS